MKKLFLPLLITSFLYSKEPEQTQIEEKYEPIFAGTLLAYFANNVPPGSLLLEPYLFAGTVNGVYGADWKTKQTVDFFDLNLVWLLETGITPWLDIALVTNQSYTSSHGHKSYLYGDTHIELGFQISKNEPDSWVPDFRIVLHESFPTGKYQNLQPQKTGADISGSGAYETWIIAVARKIIYFTPRQPITVNLTLQYDFPSNVHAKGFNLYGPTTGTTKPGSQFIGNLAFEYSLTLNWILGLDIHYLHQNRSKSHTPHLGLPSSEQFSLAPCIEYNPTATFGFELGSWFTLAGRNNISFATGVATIYWFF